MPELNFEILDVEPAVHGINPLLHFRLRVTNEPPSENIHSIILQAQIQIQSVRRSYSAEEKERLIDLFGTPDRWGQTLRNRLWTHATVAVPGFTGETEVTLPIPCTFDLNVASAKYFYALDGGDVPLLFLFSGTAFYEAADGRWQVSQIPWDRESAFALPVEKWRNMIDEHYPNTAWLYVDREVFERLGAFRRRHGIPTWDEALDRLLAEVDRDLHEEVPT